jgi:hypothetical protein
MTESDWFDSIYPDQMLTYLGERASPRKRRLFACACVRRIWSLLGDDRLGKAVKMAERFADGQVSAKVLKKARRLTVRLRRNRETEELQEATWTARAARAAAQAVEALLQEAGPILSPPRDIRELPDVVTATRTARTASRAAEAQLEHATDVAAVTHGAEQPVRRLASLDAVELVREIFGNPFRPVALDPRWLDWNENVIPRIARVIYRKRCFRNMPILADALEEAGCNDEELLMHCRAPVEHVRGCWVVDLLLGMN